MRIVYILFTYTSLITKLGYSIVKSLFTLFASLTLLSDDANKIKTLNIERA